MLAKVLIHADATGVFSSRKIAAKLVDDVVLRLLAAGNRPDFRSINRFRQQHLETFGKRFIKVVQLARKMGLVTLGTGQGEDLLSESIEGFQRGERHREGGSGARSCCGHEGFLELPLPPLPSMSSPGPSGAVLVAFPTALLQAAL